MNFPEWLTIVAVIALILAGICSLIIAFDILAGHRQQMWIMNVVWPITALYFGPLALWAYFRIGRLSAKKKCAEKRSGEPPEKQKPFWQTCALATTHCGSGCAFGDIIAEWTLFLFPVALFGRVMFAAWVLDYILAFLFGIAFQYFTIKPMRHLNVKQGLLAAFKADSLSLTSWQVGMYGWMAVATFLIFRHPLKPSSAVFWFMMQIAMGMGFLTSYPVNWCLLKKGIKEKM